MGETTQIAGSGNTLIQSPSLKAPHARGFGNQFKGDTQLNITAWDYVTGKPTYGPNRGDSFSTVQPLNGGATANEAFPTDAVPGVLVYMVTGQVPTKSSYGPRHDS